MSKTQLTTSESPLLRSRIDTHTLWAWAGSPSAVGYPLIVFLLVYPVSIGFFQEPIPELALPINYHLYDFLGGLGAAAGVFVLRIATKKFDPGNIKTTVIVVGWFVAGFAGSFLQFSIASSVGPLPPIYEDLLPFGALSFWTLSFCFTVFSTVVIQNRQAARNLTRAQATLDVLRSTMVLQVSNAQKELQERVQEKIRPVLDSLSREIKQLRTDSGETSKSSTTQRLQTAALNLIRPLSHELYAVEADVSLASSEGGAPTSSRPTLKELITRRMPLSVAFNPVLPAVLILAFFGGSYFIVGGWLGVLLGCIATTAVVMGILIGLSRLTRRVTLPLPSVLIIGIVVGGILATLYVAIPEFLIVDIPDDYQAFLAVGAGLVLVFTPLFTIFYDTRLFSLERLKQANEESATLIARMRQEVWLRQKQLAKIVHGGIQSTLNAARIRLTQAPTITPELINTVLTDLEIAQHELVAPPIELTTTIDDQLAELSSFWKGVCEVELTLDQSAQQSLLEDSSATQAVMEVVSEGISNAVKHSQAHRVQLDISQHSPNSIRIELQHLTSQIDVPQTSSGLGTQILAQLTVSWTFGIEGGVALLHAEVPLSNTAM
jgi:hypothetical protein